MGFDRILPAPRAHLQNKVLWTLLYFQLLHQEFSLAKNIKIKTFSTIEITIVIYFKFNHIFHTHLHNETLAVEIF